MPNVNVTYEEMQTTATQLIQGREQLEQQLDHLKSIVDNLISSGFQTDTASGAFSETYDKFTNGSKQTISGLDGLSQFLTSAANAMQQTDSELARAIGGS